MSRADSQLTLNLYQDVRHAMSEFEVGRNVELIEALHAWCAGQRPPLLFVWSPGGCGKSHLLQAAVGQLSERGVRTMYLPLRELLPAGPDVVADLAGIEALAIDDVDCVAQDAQWEAGLFHLHNALLAANGRLLVSASRPPAATGFALPDLQSRMAAGLIYQLEELDETGKGRVLQARAAARGIDLPEAVVDYMLRREDRNLATLLGLLARVDRAALSQHRPLTVPLVREILGRGSEDV